MKVFYSYLSDFTDSDFQSLSEHIPKEKRNKLEAVKNKKAKKESILAWYLLSKALREKGVEKYSVSFGENGKPYLENLPYFFNLSHSGDFVCCAIGERKVGLDCEKIKPVREAVIKKVLTEKERETLKDTDGDFIRFWTLKESHLKHSGRGITEELYRLDFSEFSKTDSFRLGNLFFTVECIDEYYISVCSEEKEREFIKVNP